MNNSQYNEDSIYLEPTPLTNENQANEQHEENSNENYQEDEEELEEIEEIQELEDIPKSSDYILITEKMDYEEEIRDMENKVKEETDLHNHINYFADVNNININNDK